MFYFVLSVHVVLCIALILLVMMQQGKGADMGAAFGSGGSNTLFGAGGATSMMVKLTTGAAIAFMITSISLIRLYPTLRSQGSVTADPLAGSVMSGEASKSPEAPAPSQNEASAPAAPASAPAPVEEAAENK